MSGQKYKDTISNVTRKLKLKLKLNGDQTGIQRVLSQMISIIQGFTTQDKATAAQAQ
jgi:hypothetical protein